MADYKLKAEVEFDVNKQSAGKAAQDIVRNIEKSIGNLRIPGASNFASGMRAGIFGGQAPAGLAGGAGKAAGVAALAAGVALAIAEGFKMVVEVLRQSSAMLDKMLSMITKVLLLILKPIGDIFGVALMPLLYMLKPVAMFFNMIMKPYIKKAMLAMKAGGALMKAGENEAAMSAFGLGGQILLQPLVNAIIMGMGQLLEATGFEGAAMAATRYADSVGQALDIRLGETLANTAIILDTNTKLWIDALERSGIETKSIMEGFNSTMLTWKKNMETLITGMGDIISKGNPIILGLFRTLINGIIGTVESATNRYGMSSLTSITPSARQAQEFFKEGVVETTPYQRINAIL